MRYNLHLIEDNLPEISFTSHYVESPYIAAAFYTRILESTPEELSSNTIYIIDTNNINRRPIQKGIPSIICIGMPPENWMTDDINIIYTLEDITCEEMLAKVYGIMLSLNEWRESLQEVVDKNLSPIELGIRSSKFIKNAIVVMENDFKYLFTYVQKIESVPIYLKDTKTDRSDIVRERINNFNEQPVPSPLVEMLTRSPSFVRASKETMPTLYYTEEERKILKKQSLCYNIRIEGITVSKIFINEFYEPIKPSDYYYILVLASYVRKILRNNFFRARNLSINKASNEIFTKLLSRESVSEKKIINMLKRQHWNIEDHFVCVCFDVESGENATYQAIALANSVCENPRAFLYAYYDDILVIVYNLNIVGLCLDQFIEKLRPIIISTDREIGVSYDFFDFKLLRYFFRQAAFALKQGEMSDAEGWEKPYAYNSYVAEYIVNKCLENDIESTFIPLGLRRLVEYDKTKKTHYLKVLQTYLNNERNLTNTTKDLNMSRSTLIYQIQKIENILGMSLDDSNERLVLIIGLKILGVE